MDDFFFCFSLSGGLSCFHSKSNISLLDIRVRLSFFFPLLPKAAKFLFLFLFFCFFSLFLSLQKGEGLFCFVFNQKKKKNACAFHWSMQDSILLGC